MKGRESPLLADAQVASKFPQDRRPRCRVCSRLEAISERGRSLLPSLLKFLPRFPGALPVFLRAPSLCFEKMKITRATRKLGEVPRRHKPFIDFSFAHLLA